MGLSQTGWGRLGRDMEVNYSQSGFAFGKTGVACKIPKKNQDGTYGATEWVELTFLGKAAETAAQMLFKGSKVWFIGYPQTEEWDDKQNPGQKKKQVRIIVQQWEALDPNPNSQGGGGFQQGQAPQGQQGGFNPQQQGGGGFNPQQNQQPQGGGFNPNQPGNPQHGGFPQPQQQQQPQGQQPGPQGQQPQQGFGQQQNPTGAGQGFGPQGTPQGTGDDVPF